MYIIFYKTWLFDFRTTSKFIEKNLYEHYAKIILETGLFVHHNLQAHLTPASSE